MDDMPTPSGDTGMGTEDPMKKKPMPGEEGDTGEGTPAAPAEGTDAQ